MLAQLLHHHTRAPMPGASIVCIILALTTFGMHGCSNQELQPRSERPTHVDDTDASTSSENETGPSNDSSGTNDTTTVEDEGESSDESSDTNPTNEPDEAETPSDDSSSDNPDGDGPGSSDTGNDPGAGSDETTPVDEETETNDGADPDPDTSDPDSTSLPDDGTSCWPVQTVGCGERITANTAYADPSNITLYNCSTSWESGPELAYTIDIPSQSRVTASLTPLSGVNNLDLFLIEDMGDGCDANSCIDSHSYEVSWVADPASTYFIVVDGFSEASGSFALEVTCETNTDETEANPDDETSPDDSTDNDSSTDDSTPAPSTDGCWPVEVLSCGQTISSDTASSTYDQINRYSCTHWFEAGPEIAYSFVAPRTEQLTATVNPAGNYDLDIFILEDLGQGCQEQNCIAYDNDEVSWSATAGSTYYVVIDGFTGASGPFDLSFECAGAGPEEPPPANDINDSTPSDGLSCEPLAEISCGQTVSGNTTELGITNMILNSCSTWWQSGPEVAYQFSTAINQTLTAELSTPNNNLRMALLEEQGSGCNADSCLDDDWDEIVWDAQAGSTYYLVVDGFSEAADDFELSLSCD